jgi:hypothetical protein
MANTKPTSLQELAPEFQDLLTKPVTGALATVDDNGQLQVTPVWVGTDGPYVTVTPQEAA